MIPALAVAVGLIWFFSKESKKSSSDLDPEPTPSPDPEPSPEPPIVEFEELTRWSGEESVGDSVVWEYTTGVRYDDGTEEFDSPYIVIGDAAHHNFLRQSTNRGAIFISKERTGGSTDQKNVRVFASVDDAIAYLSEEDEDDPNRPELPPSNPPSDPDSGLPPIAPDFGGGQTSLGDMTPSFGGGY